MSGPFGNDEIEDVVSSVRRLVSPDARPKSKSRDAGADRLLLTPALQVVGGSESVSRLLLTVPVVEAAGHQPEDAAAPMSAVGPEADRARDPVPADEDLAGEPSVLFGSDDEEGLPPPGADEEWEGAFWSEPEPALAELALSAEDAVLVEPVPDLAVTAAAEATLEVAAEAEAEETGPASGGVVPFPGTMQVTPAAAGVMREGHGEAEALLRDVEGAATPSGEPLDQDALMQLVRSLIREELQGSLGERITQNVRKLVRAEINRALAARSLD
jgi:hypothetical protein